MDLTQSTPKFQARPGPSLLSHESGEGTTGDVPFKLPSRRLLEEHAPTSPRSSVFVLPTRQPTTDPELMVGLPPKRHKPNGLDTSSISLSTTESSTSGEVLITAATSSPASGSIPALEGEAPTTGPGEREEKVPPEENNKPKASCVSLASASASSGTSPSPRQFCLSFGRKSDGLGKNPLALSNSKPPLSQSAEVPTAPKSPAGTSSGRNFQLPGPKSPSLSFTVRAPLHKTSGQGHTSVKPFHTHTLPPLVPDDEKQLTPSRTPPPVPSSPVASPTITFNPRGVLERATQGTSPVQQTPKLPAGLRNGLSGMDLFPREVKSMGNDSPSAPLSRSVKVGGQRCSFDGPGLIERGVRAVPDTRHAEELEAAFLCKAQGFSKSLEEMNEELAEATERLKEQAVQLYALNNEALFMNSPALEDRVRNLRGLLKNMRLDMGGLALALEGEKEE